MSQFSDLPDISVIRNQLLLDGGLHQGGNLCQRQPGASQKLLLGAGFKQAESVHEIFEWALLLRHWPALVEIGAGRIQISLGVLDLDRASDGAAVWIGQLAMGAAANSQIIAKAPVVEIVLALEARLGVGRYLILSVAGGLE